MDNAHHSGVNAEPKGPRRLSARHIVLAIGLGFAAITAASGIVGAALDFHDESPESREVFGNIPGAWELAFYVVLVALLAYGAMEFANRVKNWERGRPDNRSTNVNNIGRRLKDFRAGVYMRTLLREPAAGIMHSLIYFSFLILLAVTTILEIDHQMPESAKFLHGGVYKGFAAVGDIAGAMLLIGILWAIVRRYGPRAWRPYRIRVKSKPEHVVILGTFFAIAITGFLTEMFRIALAGRPDFEKWSVIGYPLSYIVARLVAQQRLASRAVGRPRDVIRSVPRDPADHDVAAHVHLAAQHVSARQEPA